MSSEDTTRRPSHIVVEMPIAPPPEDPFVQDLADSFWRIECNYDREGSGLGSRFEGKTLQRCLAEYAIRVVRWHDRSAGRVVVDLPEPDDILERLSGPEVGFRGRGWTVRASKIDEPTVSVSLGDYLSGGYSFSASKARLVAAAILAAADASERLSVPGEVRNGQ